MFIAQVLMISIMLWSFCLNVYYAADGRPAQEGTGGVGVIIFMILWAGVIFLEYCAGMFDKFWFMGGQ